jgi:hypothetical protein
VLASTDNAPNIPRAGRRNPDLPHGSSPGVGAIDCPRTHASIEFTFWTSRPPGSDDRVPEEHSKKSHHNNAKDKAPRVANTNCVLVGSQPVGIAHAKLLGRPPAAQPHQTLIKISLIRPLAGRCSQTLAGAFGRPQARGRRRRGFSATCLTPFPHLDRPSCT